MAKRKGSQWEGYRGQREEKGRTGANPGLDTQGCWDRGCCIGLSEHVT